MRAFIPLNNRVIDRLLNGNYWPLIGLLVGCYLGLFISSVFGVMELVGIIIGAVCCGLLVVWLQNKIMSIGWGKG